MVCGSVQAWAMASEFSRTWCNELMLAAWSNTDILLLGIEIQRRLYTGVTSPDAGSKAGMSCRSSVSKKGYAGVV